VIRNIIFLIFVLILSGCSGGLSGIMSSSAAGHWQIYRINSDPDYINKFEHSAQDTIEALFNSLWFERKYDWGKPFLKDALVTTFERKYKDRYVHIDIQISAEQIIIMSTSYSTFTEKVFSNLESELARKFGSSNIEKCYGTKDLNGHSCFESVWG